MMTMMAGCGMRKSGLWSRWALALAGLTCLACRPPCQAQQFEFFGLGDLAGGAAMSEARAVSADGKVVVGSSSSGAIPSGEAMRWTRASGMIGLGGLPGLTSRGIASGVSADGNVVVGTAYGDGRSSEAFYWTPQSGPVGLGDLPGEPAVGSLAADVSADGQVVVGTGNFSGGGGPAPVTGEAFRWTAQQGLQPLGDIPHGNGVSRAWAVSADGLTVVGKGNSGSSFQVEDIGTAMRWTSEEGMVSLGFVDGGEPLSWARDVSASGSTIVGGSQSPRGTVAFRWTESLGMVPLDPAAAGSTISEALGVSGNGDRIVGTNYDTDLQDFVAFVWDEGHGMRNLQQLLEQELGLGKSLAGWRLQQATGISADGLTIVGTGIDPDGHQQGWLTSVPEPGTSTLMIVVVLSLYRVEGRNERRAQARRAITIC